MFKNDSTGIDIVEIKEKSKHKLISLGNGIVCECCWGSSLLRFRSIRLKEDGTEIRYSLFTEMGVEQIWPGAEKGVSIADVTGGDSRGSDVYTLKVKPEKINFIAYILFGSILTILIICFLVVIWRQS